MRFLSFFFDEERGDMPTGYTIPPFCISTAFSGLAFAHWQAHTHTLALSYSHTSTRTTQAFSGVLWLACVVPKGRRACIS